MKSEDLIIGRTYQDVFREKVIYIGISKEPPEFGDEDDNTYIYEFKFQCIGACCRNERCWMNELGIEKLTDISQEYYE